MHFNSILINHEITFGAVMKMAPLPPLSLVWKVRGAIRTVTRGGARGRNPPENFSPLMEKSVGHSLKILDIFKKICAPLRKHFAPLVSQAGYGPGCNATALRRSCLPLSAVIIGVREGILLGVWKNFALKITICPETTFLV